MRWATTTLALIAFAATPARASLIVPAYSSLPGAHAKLFLEFGGVNFTGTWSGKTPGVIPAYDTDGNSNSFSAAELTSIRQIHSRVAEKYSPFNINVTTVNPGNENNKETARIIIGGDGDWYGSVVGGVALRGGFYTSSSNTAWVFPKNLAGGNPKTVAEATAHEAGHTFGLTHQSSFTQDANGDWVEQEYSTNNNDPQRRPVMGSSYGSTRGLWWNGTSTSPTTFQDDLAILSNSNNGFGYRDDDHGDSAASATPLSASVSGLIDATYGIIERITDADLFSFSTAAGSVTFWLATAEFGGMLDSTLRLFSGAGALLQTVDTNNLAEGLTTTLAAGDYLIGVSGRGNYGDLGQYTLRGQIIPIPEPAGALAGVGVSAWVMCRRRAWRR